jgi:hypothetical protein
MDEMRPQQTNSALGDVSTQLRPFLFLVLLAVVIFAPMIIMGASSCQRGHCSCCMAAFAQKKHCAQNMQPFRTCTGMIQDNMARGLVTTEPSSRSPTTNKILFSTVAFVASESSHRIRRCPARGVYSSISVLPPPSKQIRVLRL